MTEPEITDRLAATVAKYAHTTTTDQRANDQARDIPADRSPEQVWLDDSLATARRLVAAGGFEDGDGSGDCETCGIRYTLPADKASCAHKPICEDCWPNGCAACVAEVEEGIRRREEGVNRIISAALEIRTSADDLSETDLAMLGHIERHDVHRNVGLAIEALRRVYDVLGAQRAGKP